MATKEHKGSMMNIFKDIDVETREINQLKENVKQLVDQYPTLLEGAEDLLGKIAASVEAGKSLSGNEKVAKAVAGIKTLMNPENREAIAPEIKGFNSNFTIQDVIKKSGGTGNEAKQANEILMRIGEMYAASEVENIQEMLKAMEQDENKRREFVNYLNKMRTRFGQVSGKMNQQKQQ